VDLSPIDDPSLTAPTVAAATGVTIAPDDDPVNAVATALAAQAALLVLDTCEHVVGPVARLVAAVLRAGPSIRVLATSRRALGLAGELAWPVPPLELPPADVTSATEITSHAAVALFVERALAVRPDLEIDDPVAQDIASICTALDGLPLAIELAAARTDVLSPAAIRARLQDRFALLIDGGTDATERQQTLRAAIDWSFGLLSPEQRLFFARLGTFAGSFDLDAALTVAGAGLEAPLELLASLVKQSMVTRSGHDRYRLLDTLRAYALEVLAGLDADDSRERHAAFYVGLAEEGESHIRAPEQLQWLERFRLDINNFRVAIDWSLLTGNIEQAARHAGALGWFWTLNGMLSEAVQQLERLVLSGEVPPAIQARCLWGYGLLVASLGRLETARAAGYRAAELASAVGDHATTGYGLNAAAVAEWALGNHTESLDAHRAAIELFERCHDRWGLAVSKVLQARTLLDQDDPTSTLVAREGVDQARRAGDRHLLGIALTQIAHISAAEGDHQAAISAGSEALALQEQIGYSEGAVSALHVLGQSYRLAGDLGEARRLHQRALGQAFRIGHAAAVCEAVEDLARTDADERPAFALMLFRAASAERRARALPLRRRDADELARLEAALATACRDVMTDRPFPDVVAALVG
jgi:predicted ATPase